MTDAELRDAVQRELDDMWADLMLTTRDATSMPKPFPAPSRWGMAEAHLEQAEKLLAQIAAEPEPEPTIAGDLAALRICSGCAGKAGNLAWATYVICHQTESSFLHLPGYCLAYRDASLAAPTGGLEKAEMRPEWFATVDGKPAASFQFTDAWFADVGHPGYQKAWLEKVLADCRNFDGVFLDDTNMTQAWHLNGRKLDKYPTEAQWRDAMESFLAYVGPGIKSAAKLAIPNIYCPDYWLEPSKQTWVRWATYCSGSLKEFYSKNGYEASKWHTGADFDHWQDIYRRTQEAGRIFIGLTYAPMGDARSMTYARAAFLLEYEPGDGAALCFQPTNPEAQPPLAPAWTQDIGKPLGAKQPTALGWQRKFEGGQVTLNKQSGNATIERG